MVASKCDGKAHEIWVTVYNHRAVYGISIVINLFKLLHPKCLNILCAHVDVHLLILLTIVKSHQSSLQSSAAPRASQQTKILYPALENSAENTFFLFYLHF